MDVLVRIKELLQERNWSVYELSKQSGIPQSTLSNMFTRCNNPSISTLEEICNGFEITMAEFFSDGKKLDDLTFEEQKLIDIWNNLSDEKQKSLMSLLAHY